MTNMSRQERITRVCRLSWLLGRMLQAGVSLNAIATKAGISIQSVQAYHEQSTVGHERTIREVESAIRELSADFAELRRQQAAMFEAIAKDAEEAIGEPGAPQ